MPEKLGLVKEYHRYVPAGNLNIIANPKCNIVFVVLAAQEGRYVATGACEHVYIWDLRLGEKAQVLTGSTSEATRLAASPNQRFIAVGYADGTITTFDLRSGEPISTFSGHRFEITALTFDANGHRLASGSKDTDIIIWDIVAETGICKLQGHKGVITDLVFMKDSNIVISSSKDTFVKFWDIDTEYNFKTLVGHRSEVYGLTLVKEDKYLVTGCKDNDLRVWKVFFPENIDSEESTQPLTLNAEEEQGDISVRYPLRCEKVGTIVRAGRGRVISLTSDITGQVIGCHGKDNTIELFHMLPEEKVKEKSAKRLAKARKKAAKRAAADETEDPPAAPLPEVILKDEIGQLPVINLPQSCKGLDLVLGRNNELRVSCLLSDNRVELHSVNVSEKESEAKSLRSIVFHGHRTDVRAVAFASDNLGFATVSGESIKFWNRKTLACIRTVECGYAVCVTFVPGDRHLVVGLKSGKLLIVDIAVGDILEEIQAHDGELWSVCLYPDLKGVASGGSDKTVKFWQFELIEDSESDSKAKILSVIHSRTLKLEEQVLCIKITPNGKFLAVALLDSTVKIFFMDSFKFFLSLYGHKLPVLCMDISSDSSLIATGSADRNIKIWGMDFGDCHKSIFSHDDSVTAISFIPGTHCFFSCGKDGKVKEWDADSFQKIKTFQGHAGEARSCQVSPNGLFLVSCGSDKVVRLFERQGRLTLSDEMEEERARQENELSTGESTAVQGQKTQVLPSRKTVSSEEGADEIMQCLDEVKEYEALLATVKPPHPMPKPTTLMQAYQCTTTEELVMKVIRKIRASDLEEALLILPYSYVLEIFQLLPKLLKNPHEAEIAAKLAMKLLRAHYGPIVAKTELLTTLETVKQLAFEQISSLRDTVGFNLHGISYIRRVIEENEGVQLFRDSTKATKDKRKIKKHKEKALKRAIMML